MAAWGARGVWCQEFLGGLGISCKTSLDGKSFASGSSGEFCYMCDPGVDFKGVAHGRVGVRICTRRLGCQGFLGGLGMVPIA